jgi:uncharacterized protein
MIVRDLSALFPIREVASCRVADALSLPRHRMRWSLRSQNSWSEPRTSPAASGTSASTMAETTPCGPVSADGETIQPRPEEPTRRSPLRFMLLLFALSVPFWLLGTVADRFPPEGSPVNLPVSALMAFAPLFSASILAYRECGAHGVTALLKRAFAVRIAASPLWYVPVFLLMPSIYALSYAVAVLRGTAPPDPQMPLALAPVLSVAFFITALAEEVGWSGYALDPLRKRWTALGAALVLGVVWAAWHIVPDLQGDRTPTWMAWQRLSSVAFRVLIVWLYYNTGRNLFAAVTVHATDNVSWALYPTFGSHYDPFVTCVTTTAAASIVALLWGPRTLARLRYG